MFYTNVIRPILDNISSCKDRNAFCINEVFYTYGEFGGSIATIREAIRNTRFSNSNVGLVINDDIETYAAIFALWLEGAAYVPLHPNWPKERCLDILDQINADLIIDSSRDSRFEGNIIRSASLRPTNDLTKIKSALEPLQNISNDCIAYILFTSGSTGKPKGVQITRGNVGAFIDSFLKTGITLTQKDKCLQCFDLTFDVSVQSYLAPLIHGACCYTIPHGQVKYIYAAGLIEDHKLTFAAMAPSMIRFLKPYFDEIDMRSLHTCILTAEASPLSLVEEWWKVAVNTDIYDFYGPTEATIYCTWYKLKKDGENTTYNGIISIGKPMANVEAIIIDETGEIVPAGEKGELCVAGPQITPGYLNNPIKNSEAFFNKEINGIEFRFYHTGDLCYEANDGTIMYSGRLDHQIKIQGYRIEMGEIEYHASKFLKGINTVCLATESANGLAELALFIESTPIDTEELITYLKSKLPNYMIPRHIIFEPVFPLNGNAKIDKVVLKTKLNL